MTDRVARETTPERVVADAFVAGAAALRHIGTDPLLPAELLPADWPGAELRAEYAAYQRAFDAAARDWFRAPPPRAVTRYRRRRRVVVVLATCRDHRAVRRGPVP